MTQTHSSNSHPAEPRLAPDQALHYIVDMLDEMTRLAKLSQLDDVETLLGFASQAVKTRKNA